MFHFKLNDDSELRLLEPRHAENLFLLTNKSRHFLREWLPWVDFTKDVSHSKDFIVSTLKQFGDNNGFQAGIWYKGELAGVIGLHGINWANKSTSIGYWLGEEFQGKGLMTSACKSVIDYCFNELNLKRVEIRAATENQKSQAIPERLGFQKEGCIRSSEFLYDRFVDHYVYGLIKEDYNRIT
ncbi:GNAT family N-acetyltransferase [Alkalihalobacillus sp. MEB130]|uniref:GNAT family N-acetyltransferase n=1 Tax=Alkalihalobacillus sp. MEB130 TaxID=2976704 RepID=UPI0028DF43C6|nr:GNAT family protein [Alkalihalobacillus sp. MEB130]MDT8862352.1 GNAT family N-acetyltransferase [Alkalihalobacillus sp. MEB130]